MFQLVRLQYKRQLSETSSVFSAFYDDRWNETHFNVYARRSVQEIVINKSELIIQAELYTNRRKIEARPARNIFHKIDSRDLKVAARWKNYWLLCREKRLKTLIEEKWKWCLDGKFD